MYIKLEIVFYVTILKKNSSKGNLGKHRDFVPKIKKAQTFEW